AVQCPDRVGRGNLRTHIFLACLLLLKASSFGQEHTHASGERLGKVHFPTSCTKDAQEEFDHGVALLHSFEFNRAIAGFNSALTRDPTCGIAYWGIALSQWSNPFATGMKDSGQLQAGQASVQKGKDAGAKTERERSYLAAVSALYADFEKTPQHSRQIAYLDGMEALAAKYSTDHEAQIFYALAISASEDP